MNFALTVGLAVLFYGVSVYGQETIESNIANAEVERTLDLSTHLLKVTDLVTLEVTGGAPAKSFFIFIEPTLESHLAFLEAKIAGKDKASSKLLDVTPVIVKGHETKKVFKATLPSTVSGLATDKIRVYSVYSHVQRPYPKEITQTDPQLVTIATNLYYYTPYSTKKQSVKVLLASSKIESFSKEPKPVSDSGKEIRYGPYESIPAFTAAPLNLHFENNSPFLSVTSLNRWVEVSHWGNVAFEDTVDISHVGAKLKGTFSRLDYQRGLTTKASVAEFRTRLPQVARDIYYRDEIGNISTSNVRKLKDLTEVEIRPRFPLFGGWRTHYTLGYNAPSADFLFRNGGNFVLQVRFVDQIYANQIVDEATVKIALPEGAKNIQVRVPFTLERLPDEKHYTYLDFSGRPLLVFRMKNSVEEHIQPIQVQYSFDRVQLLYEPLMVIVAFALLFLFVIVYVRLDFSIVKPKTE